MSAALVAAFSLAWAQTSEFDALPKPPKVAAPPPSPSEPTPSAHEKSAVTEPKQKSAGDKTQVREQAKEKENAKEKAAVLPGAQEAAREAARKSAAIKEKEKDEGEIQARKMAPSAAIPPWPGDEKGPKTIEFLGACPGNFDRCMDQVRDVGEKMSSAELCIPADSYFANVTDRVRKWATLRPDIQNLPSGRVIAAALRSIYPCKAGAPARTAAEKGTKGAKAAQ